MENIEITTRKTEDEVKVIEPINFIVPDCCREGWKTCKHVVKKSKTPKRNIGL